MTGKKKVLILEPRQYFEALGVCEAIESRFDVNYGISFSFNLDKFLLSFDAVISCIYHSASSQFVTARANYLGVKTVFLFDGVGDWDNFNYNTIAQLPGQKLHSPLFHNVIFCCDVLSLKYFTYQGVETYMYMPDRVCNRKNNRTAVANDAERPIKSKLDKVLITTANSPFFSEEEKWRLIELLKKLKSELVSDGINICVRIFDDELYDACFPEFLNLKSDSFSEVAKSFSMVFTTPSSLIAECSNLGVPVCLLDYRPSPLFVQGACRYNGMLPWLEVKLSLLSNYKESMVFQNSQFYYEGISAEKLENEGVVKIEKLRFFNVFIASDYIIRLFLKKFNLIKKVKSFFNDKKS